MPRPGYFVLAACAVACMTACGPVTVAPQPTEAPASSTEVPVTVPAARAMAAPPRSSNPVPATSSVEITWYGSYDNSPPGSLAIDGGVIHATAGGTGTWADPLTFASPTGTGAYAYGTRIYVPSVDKYFIREDSCEVSWTAPDGCGAVTHVDLYIGNPSATKAVLKCEDELTPDGNAPIVVNPAPDLPVDATPLWSDTTGVCHTKAVPGPVPTTPAPTSTPPPTSTPAPPVPSPVVYTTKDSKSPLKITTPGTYDGQGHKVPNIDIEASGVTIRHFVVSGGKEAGIVANGSSNVVADNTITQVSYGTDDLDALRFWGDNVQILRNKTVKLVKGKLHDAHPDGGGQTWASASHPTSSHVLIADNDWVGSDFHQCVTAEGPKATDVPPGGTGVSTDWIIRNNHCEGTSSQAIVLRDIHGVQVIGNDFEGHDNKAVQVADGTDGVTFSGNTLGKNVKTLTGD